MTPLTPERLAEIKARCEAIRVKDFELPAMVHEFLLLVPDCLAEIERLRVCLQKTVDFGHNDDCIMCGAKDGIAPEALGPE